MQTIAIFVSGKSMGFGGLQYRILLSLIIAGPAVFGTEFSAQLNTYLGRDLSPEEPKTSIALEPDLGLVSGNTRLGFYTLVDRPTDPYEKLTLPKTILSLSHQFPFGGKFTISPSFSSNLISLDRWSIDGYQIRNTLSVGASLTASGWTIGLRGGGFLFANEYSTQADRSSSTRHGLVQRLDVKYEYARLAFQLKVIVEQSFNGIWSNSYATAESVGYRLSDVTTVSLEHEILSSVIDGSTGFRRSLRVSDGRDSRVSMVLGLKL